MEFKHGIEATRGDLRVGMRVRMRGISAKTDLCGVVTEASAGHFRVDDCSPALDREFASGKPVTILTEPDDEGRDWELGVPGSALRIGDVVRWRESPVYSVAGLNRWAPFTVLSLRGTAHCARVGSKSGSYFTAPNDTFDRLISAQRSRDTEPTETAFTRLKRVAVEEFAELQREINRGDGAKNLNIACDAVAPNRHFELPPPKTWGYQPTQPPVLTDCTHCALCKQPYGPYRVMVPCSCGPRVCGDCHGSVPRDEAPQPKRSKPNYHDNDVGWFASPSWED